MLEGNRTAEATLLELMKQPQDASPEERVAHIANAKATHFAKLSVSLLKDFIRARKLTDASDASLDKSFPKKGTVKTFKAGENCLHAMAYELRGALVTAKPPQTPSTNV